MSDPLLRRQLELLQEKLEERNTTIGMLNHQLDLTQSELGALKEVHLAATASEPADKARDVKLEHEQRDGSEPSESSDIGSNDSELEDPHGSDPVWDLEGVWRCGDPECGWEVADGRCVGCDWEYYKGHGEERWDYFAQAFAGRAYTPEKGCSECYSLGAPPHWIPTPTPWAHTFVDTSELADPARLSEIYELLARGASPSMIDLFSLSYDDATGIVARATEDTVARFAPRKMGADDEWRLYLGRAISLAISDDDGEKYISDALDEFPRPHLEAEGVWAVVVHSAECDHWQPTVPPSWTPSEEHEIEERDPLEGDYDMSGSDIESELESGDDDKTSDSDSLDPWFSEPSMDGLDSDRESSSVTAEDELSFWEGFMAVTGETAEELPVEDGEDARPEVRERRETDDF